MRPLVIFRKYDENSDDEDDGEWGVSVNGKYPEVEYFYGCESKVHAKRVQELMVDYISAKTKLLKEMSKSLDKYDDYDIAIWKLTEPH